MNESQDEMELMPTSSSVDADEGDLTICVPNPDNTVGNVLPSPSDPCPIILTKGKQPIRRRKRKQILAKYKRAPCTYFCVLAMGITMLVLILTIVGVETWRSNTEEEENEKESFDIHSKEDEEHHREMVERVNGDRESTWIGRYNRYASRHLQSGLSFDPSEATRIFLRQLHLDKKEVLLEDTEEHGRNISRQTVHIPRSFDSRLKWPLCWSVHQVNNQGGCGSCWSTTASSVMSDRVCIGSEGRKQTQISAQDLTSCCAACGGCDGTHWALSSFTYFKEKGIVSGGSYGSFEGCRPYELPASCGSPCSAELYRRDRTPICEEKCIPQYGKKYEDDRVKGNSAYWIRAENGSPEAAPIVKQTIMKILKESRISEVEFLKRELFLYGPVLACFTVHENFQHYHSGIYDTHHPESEELYGHCAKLLGWGVDSKDREYWIYANTWGREWGEKGFFRIAITNLPEEVVAGTA